MFVSALRSVGACRRGRRRAVFRDLRVRHCNGELRLSVLARRLTGQLEEDVVERRAPQAHVADADAGVTKRCCRLLDEDEALARRREGQPVRTPVLLRGAAADLRERRLGLVTLRDVGQLHLEDLAADAVLELVTGPFRDHPAVVDHGDLVRELIRLFEVLRRQQDRRALAAQVADDLPDLVATPRIETGGRLVEEEQARPGEQAGREVESPSHPARVGLRRPLGGVGELEALQQLRCATAGLLW